MTSNVSAPRLLLATSPLLLAVQMQVVSRLDFVETGKVGKSSDIGHAEKLGRVLCADETEWIQNTAGIGQAEKGGPALGFDRMQNAGAGAVD